MAAAASTLALGASAAQAALLELSMLFDLDARGSDSVGKSWSEEIFPLARQQCLFAIGR